MTDADDAEANDDQRWVIVRDGTEFGADAKFLSESQEWASVDTAMTFATAEEAENGSETLCPPFTTGHAEPRSSITSD